MCRADRAARRGRTPAGAAAAGGARASGAWPSCGSPVGRAPGRPGQRPSGSRRSGSRGRRRGSPDQRRSKAAGGPSAAGTAADRAPGERCTFARAGPSPPPRPRSDHVACSRRHGGVRRCHSLLIGSRGPARRDRPVRAVWPVASRACSMRQAACRQCARWRVARRAGRAPRADSRLVQARRRDRSGRRAVRARRRSRPAVAASSVARQRRGGRAASRVRAGR